MIAPARSAAIVTAAGFSSRMGRPKALLDWKGKALIQHQVDALTAWGEVLIVLGHEAERIRAALALPAHARCIVNPDYPQGRASSLKAGFEALTGVPEAVLVVGVDQPLEGHSLDRLVEAMSPDEAIAIPVCEGRKGHPVIFSGRLLDELKAIREEDQGLRAVVRRHEARLVEVSGPFWDLNRPEDYAAALAPPAIAQDSLS